jgi:hypothetical protein
MFNQLATQESIEKTKAAMETNGFSVIVAKDGAEAKEKVLELVPKGAEVFALSSETLKQTGITKEIDESGNYSSIRAKLNSLDRQKDAVEMRKLGAAPDYAIGSAHAVTEDGKILIASNTGSQLPADSYGAGQLILVIGTQKITKDEAEAQKRIREYVLPLESARMNKQYNMTAGSVIRKLLTLYSEFNAKRITVILVNEVLGF